MSGEDGKVDVSIAFVAFGVWFVSMPSMSSSSSSSSWLSESSLSSLPAVAQRVRVVSVNTSITKNSKIFIHYLRHLFLVRVHQLGVPNKNIGNCWYKKKSPEFIWDSTYFSKRRQIYSSILYWFQLHTPNVHAKESNIFRWYCKQMDTH